MIELTVKNTDALELEDLYVVRLYDGFDHQWIDVSKPVTKKKAEKIYNEKTNGGTEKTSYNDIDYYDIFEADTKMLVNDKPF